MRQTKILRPSSNTGTYLRSVPNLYTYLAIAIMLAFMALLTFVDLSAFLPLQTKDAETIANIAESGISGEINSYKATALVYSLLSPNARAFVTFGFGSAFVISCLISLRRPFWLGIMAFMLFGPTIFYLIQFNKDTLLLPFVLISAFLLRANIDRPLKVGLIFLVYCGYAVMFRPYYFMIGGVFVGLVVMTKLSRGLQALLVFSALTISILLPEHIFYNLQSFRDSTNATRIIYGADAGARTAFMNLVEPTSIFNFMINYVYATLRLNLPFLFDFNIKDFALVINIMILIYAFGRFYKSRVDSVSIAALLFTSHFLVLQIFEPDLGTYFRHISITLPYCVPALMLAEQASAGFLSKAKPRRGARPPALGRGRVTKPPRPPKFRSKIDDARA